MSGKFDVVIAGAGPSGSTAAFILADRGYRVALLDKCSFPRKKLCGGLLTVKSVDLFKRLYGYEVEDLFKLGIVFSESSDYSVNYRDKKIRDGKSPVPFRFVDRMVMDKVLLDRAIEAGAVFFPGEQVVECNAFDAEVKTASRRIFRGEYLIAADGVNSTIRRLLPFDKKKWRSNLASTIEVSIDTDKYPREVKAPEIYIGCLRAGYGWVFPGKGKVVAGIGGLNSHTCNFKAEFMDFLRSQGINDPESIKLSGFPLPYGNYIKNPYYGKTFLVGDAAGLVEPLFGEGIFYAIQTGRYVAESLAGSMLSGLDPKKQYRERLEKFVIPELVYSNRLRWALFYAQRLLKHLSFKIFFKSLPSKLAEMVHGIRSYKFLLKKNWD
ncbi:geranylgeranyl reductase family protein [Maridesulfovibrio bastinii]|uniref:geranylgeranyl reductase family protein n=1 Tax=Maridesulfovibrio bastinii TaxID=47157 RepID=UPI00041D791D|nr:geranylgeranyl reductase family protein [Maridesulfovibrio bastinii]